MFKGKPKKRLVRVKILMTHARSMDKREPDVHMVIYIEPGQKFVSEISYDAVYEDGVLVRSFDWKAGCTVIREFEYE